MASTEAGSIPILTQSLTDFKIGTSFMTLGALIYICDGYSVLKANAATGRETKAIQVSADIIFAVFTTVATSGLMYISFFNGWRFVFTDFFQNFDDSGEWSYKRYFIGNLLMICMWLLWLPIVLPFIYCCWALYQFNTSGVPPNNYNYNDCIVAFLAGMAGLLWITFFWVYSAFPSNLRRNGGYGSTNLIYYLTVVGLICIHCIAHEPEDNSEERPNSNADISSRAEQLHADAETTNNRWCECFATNIQRPILGSDFAAGSFIYMLSTFVGLFWSSYERWDHNPGGRIYNQGLSSTIFYVIGTVIFWYASYPHHVRQNSWEGSSHIYLLITRVIACVWLVQDESPSYLELENISASQTEVAAAHSDLREPTTGESNMNSSFVVEEATSTVVGNTSNRS